MVTLKPFFLLCSCTFKKHTLLICYVKWVVVVIHYQYSTNPYTKPPNIVWFFWFLFFVRGVFFFFLPECKLVRCCRILVRSAVFWYGSSPIKQETENNLIMLHYFYWEDAEVQYSQLHTTLLWWREPETRLASKHEAFKMLGIFLYSMPQRSIHPPNNISPCSLHSASILPWVCFVESCLITGLVMYTALFSGFFIKILSLCSIGIYGGGRWLCLLR